MVTGYAGRVIFKPFVETGLAGHVIFEHFLETGFAGHVIFDHLSKQVLWVMLFF